MKVNRRKVSFQLGFLVSVAIWIVFFLSEPGDPSKTVCFDCDRGFGRPFRVFEPGNAVMESHIVWGGIILNFLIVVFAGVALGYIFQLIWKVVSDK